MKYFGRHLLFHNWFNEPGIFFGEDHLSFYKTYYLWSILFDNMNSFWYSTVKDLMTQLILFHMKYLFQIDVQLYNKNDNVGE